MQCTGNGHVARAREIIPILQKYGDVDVVLSGDQCEVPLPVKPKYWSKGLTLIYDKSGGVSNRKTMLHNNFFKIAKEVRNFPIQDYDLVINDFEFISAWACRLRKKPCYGMGHQVSFLSKKTPRPKKKSRFGELILKHYAPMSHRIGFHFDHFDEFIQKPVIRGEIRNAQVTNNGHYTAYLPAFSDEKVYNFLIKLPKTNWEVFSRNAKERYTTGNVAFFPISNERFIESFVSCEGIITSAGFETPAEAIYMGKKVMVCPIKSQYEQYCNAAAIEEIGVPVVFSLDKEALRIAENWMICGRPIQIDYPDVTEQIIYEQIIRPFLKSNQINGREVMKEKAVR